MSSITCIMIGEIRLNVNDIIYYKPLYSKNILETVLARVNGNNTIHNKFKCREELEEVVKLLDSIFDIRTIKDFSKRTNNENINEDITTDNVIDNSSCMSREIIKPAPPEISVKKEREESPLIIVIKNIKENISRIFKNQHKW